MEMDASAFGLDNQIVATSDEVIVRRRDDNGQETATGIGGTEVGNLGISVKSGAQCTRCGTWLDNGDFSVFRYHNLQCEEASIMDWKTFLEGVKPEDNDKFDIIKGHLTCVIKAITFGKRKFPDGTESEPQYSMELQVAEVLDGNGIVGRRFWKRYEETDEDMKKLMDDLAGTSGIVIDQSHDKAGFDASLDAAVGKTVYVLGGEFTPVKNIRDGSEIPEAERRTFQSVKIIGAKRVKKLVEKAGTVPF